MNALGELIASLIVVALVGCFVLGVLGWIVIGVCWLMGWGGF